MRVVITGATGNVGTSVVQALATEPAVSAIVGVARRRPAWNPPKTTWQPADVAEADLASLFLGADAVVHLAWLIQPSHREDIQVRTNVDGSARVLAAVAAAGVPTLIHASSVGTYAPGPKDRRVDESWPTTGIETSPYSRHKAAVERMLDRLEEQQRSLRVVRLRPGLIFKREAACGIRRLFLGPFFPGVLLRRGLLPILPDVPTLRFQAVHSLDVGEAVRLALLGTAAGAFNLAADPVLDVARIARILATRTMRVPEAPVRMMTSAAWHLHLQPADAGWFDLATKVPLMDASRACRELGWSPQFSGLDAVREILAGIRDGADFPTPPLSADTSGPLRLWEITTGVGARDAA